MLRPLVLALLLVLAACTTEEPGPTTAVTTASSTSTTTPSDSSTTSSTDPTTDTTDVEPAGESITVVVDAIRAVALAETAAAFTEATGVRVDLIAVDGGEIRGRAVGEDVDVFMGPHIWRDELVAEGLISAIDGFPDGVFVDIATEAFRVDGESFGIPFAAETLVLYINEDMHGGPPPTELLGGCPARDAPCFVMPGLGEAGGFHLTPFLMAAADGDLLSAISDPDAIGPGLAAFASIVSSPDHDLTSIANARARIVDGASLFVGGPWDLGPIVDSGITFSVAPLPPVGETRLVPPVAVQGFYLSSTAPNADDASAFLTEWLAGPQAQMDLWLRDMRAPVIADLLDESESVGNAFLDAVRAGFLLPAVDLEPIWEELGAAAAQIYDGADPSQAVLDAADRIRDRLG